MRSLVRKAGLCAGVLAALYLCLALGLTLVPAPQLRYPLSPQVSGAAPTPSCRASVEIRCIPARDGFQLALRQDPLPSPRPQGASVVLLLHGVLSSGAELAETARQLQATTGAEVFRLDLRDHGLSRSRDSQPGIADLDHLGQYEEDVADVLAVLRREHPRARIVLAGHSMGGGIAVRYALIAARSAAPSLADGYLLLAPHLGERAPISHPQAKPGATPADPPVIQLALPRTIGLAMLNVAHIRALNGLLTLFFDLPFPLPVKAYTFRAMASTAPDDYAAALRADAKPMLVLVGEKDEAFDAHAYPAVVALHRNGKTVLIPGASHDGICLDPRVFEATRAWLEGWATVSEN